MYPIRIKNQALLSPRDGIFKIATHRVTYINRVEPVEAIPPAILCVTLKINLAYKALKGFKLCLRCCEWKHAQARRLRLRRRGQLTRSATHTFVLHNVETTYNCNFSASAGEHQRKYMYKSLRQNRRYSTADDDEHGYDGGQGEQG
jgi:hypothetical protein